MEKMGAVKITVRTAMPGTISAMTKPARAYRWGEDGSPEYQMISSFFVSPWRCGMAKIRF